MDINPVKSVGSLYVDTNPKDAHIKILNSRKIYQRGMDLQSGRYHVEVTRQGYIKKDPWISLGPGESKYVDVTLVLDFGNPIEGTWTDTVTDMEFVWVPKGCFQMGSNNGGSNEKPVHKVCLDGFWMGKYEVTQGQWKAVMGNNPSKFKKGDGYPVDNVSWKDAMKLIKKLNNHSSGHTFDLPSEAQWEYAARSRGKDQKYAGGNDVDKFAWYYKNSDNSTHKVGSRPPNDIDIYDMSGNVWEWCKDTYTKDSYRNHDKNNPIYTNGGLRRVNRGGSWRLGPTGVRCARRSGKTPAFRSSNLGFRLLRTN